MAIGRSSAAGLVSTILVSMMLASVMTGVAVAQTPADSLMLQAPEEFRVWRNYNPITRSFVVFMTWEDVPDDMGTYIHPPDTTGWVVEHLVTEMTVPTSSGMYTGDIDRTVAFRALDTGQVGIDSQVRISFAINREEYLNGVIDVGSPYVPGTPVPIIFRDNRSPGVTVDFGLRVAFSDGWVDRQGGFLLGAEDFEGYHIWRGIQADGSDLTVIGELSKEEAFKGSFTGGSFADSIYYYSVIPALRTAGTWFSPFGGVDCLGTRINLELTDNQLMWFDCNAFNGFTYYYAVTTFDRDYAVQSGRQGLVKFDNCQPFPRMPYECEDELFELTIEVDSQDDVNRVYAIPNPFRSGGSRLTQQNYHNFPDNMVRFVNVPDFATIRIYTVAGDLVWESEHTDGSGNIEWNVENGNSEPVASGVYIYKIEAGSGDTVYGRLVVIR